VYGKIGQAEEGLNAVSEALALINSTGERSFEAELYRLKGELTLQKLSVVSCQLLTPGSQGEAEECFLKAIEIARKQQAKSLSYAPQRASLVCGNNKVRKLKLTSCCRRCIAGLPKALTPRTCKR
jgi:hypothetical protein